MEHKQELGHKEPSILEIQHLEMDQTIHGHQGPVSSLSQSSSDTIAETTTTIEDEQEVSFFHDFIAGGVAGSASVIVGHPMDTLKVRMQTAKGNPSMASLAFGSKYGGSATLFRGMAAPLSAASAVNAIIFSSYGWSSRLYEQYSPRNDPSLKAFTCGSFSGLVQAAIICPMEHVKCRLQVQETVGSTKSQHPLRTTLRAILRSGGSSFNVPALYRGWWITCWREVPAFGAYFALYDILKDRIQSSMDRRNIIPEASISAGNEQQQPKAHTWLASGIAGGLTGAVSWAIVYPFDVIKTQIQTIPIDTPQQQRTISFVTARIIKEHGWKHLFRGLTVTCLRSFPVNGIIFPVYEYTLLLVCAWES